MVCDATSLSASQNFITVQTAFLSSDVIKRRESTAAKWLPAL